MQRTEGAETLQVRFNRYGLAWRASRGGRRDRAAATLATARCAPDVEAMLALPTTTLGTLILRITPANVSEPHLGDPSPRAFLRSTMPALDHAYGLDAEMDLPEDLAALVAQIHAGPLGRMPLPRAAAPHQPAMADAS